MPTTDGRADEELDALLGRLDELTDDDAMLLAEAWQQEDGAARRRAWARAKTEIGRTRREKLLDRARHAVGRWAAAGRSDYHGIAGLLGQPGEHTGLRMAAAPAVLDAVAALLGGDALDDDERAVLTRPWRSLAEQARFDGPPASG